MTRPLDTDDSAYADVNPLSDDEGLEEQDGPEASTVNSGSGPNDAGVPPSDASGEDERP